jgi:hypothetical protein
MVYKHHIVAKSYYYIYINTEEQNFLVIGHSPQTSFTGANKKYVWCNTNVTQHTPFIPHRTPDHMELLLNATSQNLHETGVQRLKTYEHCDSTLIRGNDVMSTALPSAYTAVVCWWCMTNPVILLRTPGNIHQRQMWRACKLIVLLGGCT